MTTFKSKIKNQLFRFIPPREVLMKLLSIFGLSGLDDNRNFTRQDMIKLNTLEEMYKLKTTLEEYYLPCKARTYLNDITYKNIITILRQVVRLYGHSVISREKYIKGDKFIIYQIISAEERDYKPINHVVTETNKNCVLTFE